MNNLSKDQSVSGFFFIDKPEYCSSFDLIRDLRKKTSYRKIGHTGTLDPFASGLVILCLNKATKLSSFIINSDKEYIVKMELGIQTDTGDREGTIIKRLDPIQPDKDLLNKAVERVLQLKIQRPPQFSAKKISGKAAYKYAREGKQVDLPEKEIHISDFRIISANNNIIVYKTTVSKGTYIRTLTETFAELFENIAYTTELRRLSIGDISVKDAIKLADITDSNWQQYLKPINSIKWDCPIIHLQKHEIRSFLNGLSFKLDKNPEANLTMQTAINLIDIPKVVVYSSATENCDEESECLGIASIKNGILYPKRVL